MPTKIMIRVGIRCALLFLVSIQAFGEEITFSPERARAVSETVYWHKLLHYKARVFGGLKSQADGPEFFLSRDGKTNPLSELLATVDAFSNTAIKIGYLKQHPQCAFPERYRFLKNELKLKIEDVHCDDFLQWRERFHPESATLVFASAYLGSPASMFGHTLLRIDSKPRKNNEVKNDLLDYGVNYGAVTGTDGSILFAAKGLLGGYQGFFSLQPYFEKVSEYNDSESRDMWEYRLNLTDEQIQRMLGHLWEMGTTWFDYYFFDENCSYALLSLLEVANPDWHLTDQFFYWVIPSDTVRVLKHAGAIGAAKLRPSLLQTLRQKMLAFSSDETRQFFEAVDHELELSGKESSLVLDTLAEYQKYRLMKLGRDFNDFEKQRHHRLLLARTKTIDQNVELVAITSSDRPDIGNDTAKIALYGGARQANGYVGLDLRPVYHDILDQDEGYLKNSAIMLAHTDVRYWPESKRFQLQEFTFAQVDSLTDLNFLQRRVSWRVKGGVFEPKDLDCTGCTAAGLSGGIGASRYLDRKQQRYLLYALFTGGAAYAGVFDRAFRVGPGVSVGLLSSLPLSTKLNIEVEQNYFPTQYQMHRFTTRVTGMVAINFKKDWELRGGVHFIRLQTRGFVDGQGGLAWYF